MDANWGNAVVVDPKELQRLQEQAARLRKSARRLGLAASTLLAIAVACSTVLWHGASQLRDLSVELKEAKKNTARANLALGALARSHENILAATEQAPSMGTRSWGRRFTVTMYVPRSEKYGKDNDGLTATMTKADPAARIVAVDPKLIPYGSWVWVEGLGWYRAEDCGSAIKGFRLDLLTATEREAMNFGRQDRFVIVVPPTDA